jgi:hypothetical protein
MSDKEARVRLTLNSGSFLGGMQQLSGDVQRISKNMETALQTPFSGGLKAAKENFGKIRGEISAIAKMGLGLGGGFEVASAVKGALEMSGAYKNLSFQIEAATGQIVKSETIQKQVEETAKKCKRANQEVAESYNDIFVHTGNVAFAAKATDAVAVAAQAAQKPMSIFADIAAQLNKTLGITADEMPTALAAMTSLAGKGADLTELSAVLMRTGASAKVMGLEGTSGLGKLAGMFEVMVKGGAARRQATSGLNEIMGDLTDPTKMKAMQEEIQKKFHKHTKLVNSRGGIMSDAMFRIMDATGGDSSKLKGLFPSAGGAGFMSEIGKHYQEELGKGGGKASAREATERWIQDLGKSSLSAARQLQQMEENNKKVGSDMTDAMNEMEHVFAEPEMLNALKQMAHVMPKVAHAAAEVLEFLVKHPLWGGGALIGAKVGSGFLEGFGASMTQALSKKIVAEVMAQKMTVLAKPILDGLGMKIGQEFVTVAAASTPWQNAGKLAGAAMGVAIGAYLVETFGEWIIDKSNKQKADIQNTAAVGVAVSGTGDKAQIEPALKKARQALKVAEGEARSLSHMGMGGMGSGMSPGSGEVIETTETKAARESVRVLEEALRGLARSSRDASGSLDKIKTSAGDAASNGLPKTGSNDPGAS